ncbi:unnamed protein product [Paramecium primaurelia]|uniref:Uncharacterized protein n=1 Tax=Paramecium primaurelia TaxID=5886 RepID=A0A8S1QQG5_PARPR|nr:unnamed protein product [Paramecium primaurelia]
MHENESKLSEVNAPPLFICFDVVNKLPISLQSVHYIVNVQPGLAIVEIQQNYNTQHYEVPIELEYMFTIQKDSVVSKMVAELGDIKVFGIVKELKEAKKEYQQGIQAGKTMILGEQDKQITDLKKVKIGCLAPGKSLKITFEYIQPLKVYLNQFWMLELSPMVDSSYLTVYQLKNQSVNYPQLYNQIQKSVNFQGLQQNYQQDITININLQKPITFVKSPTHQILINNDDNQFVKENFTKNQIIILDKKYPNNFLPNKKFELLFSSDDVNSPHSFLTHTNNDALQHIKYCATLTLIPKFNEVPLDDAYSSYINGLNLSSETKINRGNYYFFIDRSGSMEGQRIQKAKQSLILFLKSLPENSLFNVISFGSQPKRMFEKSQVYNQKSLNEAISQVNSMDADLGGTDIFSALKNGIYNDKDSKSHLETYNAFLLTDGEDSPEKILNLVQNQTKSNFRIYTLGIGDGCSQYLLKNIAEIGNGKCQFVADNEDINVKVIDLLEDSMTQYLEGFKLELPEINISQIIPDPESITAIKKNEELVIQILFPTPIQNSLDFQIKCFDPQKQTQISYKFELKINESQQQDYFHKLAAHKLINYYEYSLQNRINQVNKIKVNQVTFNNEDIINLSIQNQILSKNTAYICQICHLEDEFKQLIKEKIFYQNQTFQVQQLRKGLDYSIQQRIDLNPSFVMNKLGCLDIQCCIDDEECYEQQQCCMDLKLGSIQQNMCMDREDLDSYEKKSCKSPSIDQDDQPQKLMEFEQMQERSSLNNIIIPNSQETAVVINYIDLLQCVQADGSFILNKKFGDSIKLSSLNNDNHYEEILWTTIIALFYLELHCISDKASWQLIYQKAILLLKKNGLDYFKIKTEYYNNYQKLFEVSN